MTAMPSSAVGIPNFIVQVMASMRRFNRRPVVNFLPINARIDAVDSSPASSCAPTLMVSLLSSDRADPQSALGDRSARFNAAIIPQLDAAYNFARYLSRDADAAQDIVQEAFLRAYRSFDGYMGGDARAWIFAIVRNCFHAWSQETKRKRRFEMPLSSGYEDKEEPGASVEDIATEDDTPEIALIRTSQSECVRSVINSLPDDLREILVLRELEQLSYRQIAEVINLPLGTVMSRLARARRKFGKLWQNTTSSGE